MLPHVKTTVRHSLKLFLHVKIKRTDFDKETLRNRILVIPVIKERNVSLARIHPLQSPTFHHKKRKKICGAPMKPSELFCFKDNKFCGVIIFC